MILRLELDEQCNSDPAIISQNFQGCHPILNDHGMCALSRTGFAIHAEIQSALAVGLLHGIVRLFQIVIQIGVHVRAHQRGYVHALRTGWLAPAALTTISQSQFGLA